MQNVYLTLIAMKKKAKLFQKIDQNWIPELRLLTKRLNNQIVFLLKNLIKYFHFHRCVDVQRVKKTSQTKLRPVNIIWKFMVVKLINANIVINISHPDILFSDISMKFIRSVILNYNLVVTALKKKLELNLVDHLSSCTIQWLISNLFFSRLWISFEQNRLNNLNKTNSNYSSIYIKYFSFK